MLDDDHGHDFEKDDEAAHQALTYAIELHECRTTDQTKLDTHARDVQPPKTDGIITENS